MAVRQATHVDRAEGRLQRALVAVLLTGLVHAALHPARADPVVHLQVKELARHPSRYPRRLAGMARDEELVNRWMDG